MEPKKFRFAEIKKGVPIPTPRDLTPEEEAALIAQLKEEFDPVASEAECRDLLRQRELGLLLSGEELLKNLEAMEASDEEFRKEWQ